MTFSDDPVSELLAQSRVVSNHGLDVDFGPDSSDLGGIALHDQTVGGDASQKGSRVKEQFEYDILTLDSQRYLCQIPQVEDTQSDDPNNTLSKADEEKELVRANNRGWELLQEGMQGNCIYYWSGWWSYRYCYGQGVKQFHALPARPGMPPFPPTEDPSITGFELGKVEAAPVNGETGLQTGQGGDEIAASNAIGYLETRGDARYLVQRLDGGSVCDLTGRPRRVEVQVSITR